MPLQTAAELLTQWTPSGTTQGRAVSYPGAATVALPSAVSCFEVLESLGAVAMASSTAQVDRDRQVVPLLAAVAAHRTGGG